MVGGSGSGGCMFPISCFQYLGKHLPVLSASQNIISVIIKRSLKESFVINLVRNEAIIEDVIENRASTNDSLIK